MRCGMMWTLTHMTYAYGKMSTNTAPIQHTQTPCPVPRAPSPLPCGVHNTVYGTSEIDDMWCVSVWCTTCGVCFKGVVFTWCRCQGRFQRSKPRTTRSTHKVAPLDIQMSSLTPITQVMTSFLLRVDFRYMSNGPPNTESCHLSRWQGR